MELPKERLRNRHEPTHHRGRAALQRRVQPYYKENGLQPLRSSLARHRKLARNGTTSVVPKPANKIDRSSPHGYAAIITDATHHRGRAALQRRVKPSKKNGLQPLWMARRKDCCLPKPPRTGGATDSSPESLKATRSGRTRPQSRLKPSKNAIEPATTALTRRESNHLKPAQHRGRAALQRRVQRSKEERASAPKILSFRAKKDHPRQRMFFRSRGTCCQATPPRTKAAPSFAHFAKGGIPRTHPSRIWQRHDREGLDFSS